MPSNVLSLLASIVVAKIKNFDFIAVFDKSLGEIYSISVDDFIRKSFDNFSIVKRVADIAKLCSSHNVYMYGLADYVSDFMENNPNAKIDMYLSSRNKSTSLYSDEVYILSYIHLYKVYKSLGVLVENGYTNLVDTFIDHCIKEVTDHPGTICYSAGEIHNVLKLRKAVYNCLKNYLNDHESYVLILRLAQKFKYTDKQFREVKKHLKKIEKSKERLVKEKSKIVKAKLKKAKKKTEDVSTVRTLAVKTKKLKNSIALRYTKLERNLLRLRPERAGGTFGRKSYVPNNVHIISSAA